jgi:hypothetical protein
VTKRERVLQAYGAACQLCGRTGPLHIDHVRGGGSRHRLELGATKVEAWLCRERRRTGHWPPEFTLLCPTHHQMKTQRERQARMPARKGGKAVTIVLDEAMAAEVKARCQDPRFEGEQSNVVAQALTQFFEQEATQVAVVGFQLQLRQEMATVGKAFHEVLDQMAHLTAKLTDLERRVQAQTSDVQTVKATVETGLKEQRQDTHRFIQVINDVAEKRKWGFNF